MRLIQVFLMAVIFCSCNSQMNEKKNEDSKIELNKEEESTVDTLSQIDNVSINDTMNIIGENGLLTNLKGTWINTSLFDSTSIKKKLFPWLNDYYGDLLLIINESESATINGNMDGGTGDFKLIDSISFSIPDRYDNPVFTYSLKNDLIYQNIDSEKPLVFRKVRANDNLDIIANEKAFNKYFIDRFFTDYFSESEKAKIVEIWDGFETYTPFKFDAVAMKNKNGQIEYFAWKFAGDTLFLYETSYENDENSGFPNYKIEKLKQKITKK